MCVCVRLQGHVEYVLVSACRAMWSGCRCSAQGTDVPQDTPGPSPGLCLHLPAPVPVPLPLLPAKQVADGGSQGALQPTAAAMTARAIIF